jgi:pimeloyl-ACP methyl ester carboxylesterase
MSVRSIVCLSTALAVSGAASPVLSQDTPVVFVHGFGSKPGTWAETASRLQSRLHIQSHVPSVPWWERFQTQAEVLQSAGRELPDTTVAVGHSNGGLVSRQWSTMRPLHGIVTLGTPHQGSLLAQHGLDLVNFNYLLYNYASFAAASFGIDPNEFTWIFIQLQAFLSFSKALSAQTISALGAAIGIGLGAPVLPDMVPGSHAINSLNSGSNLSREHAQILHRVGLVFVAHDYWRAGPAVGLAPDHREDIWAWKQLSIVVFETAAAVIQQTYPPWNAAAMSLVNGLRALSGVLRNIDPYWCWAVTNDLTCSTSHDGIVATQSQFYPEATSSLGFYGPAHLQQTSRDDILFAVLKDHVGILPRGAAPPPSQPPCCAPPPGADTLLAGQRLMPDTEISSPSGVYALRYQTDGNLVLYQHGGTSLWASQTAGDAAGYAEMQGDGNFVVYDAASIPVWASGTSAYGGAYLKVQDDGYVVIYEASGVPIWWVGGQ